MVWSVLGDEIAERRITLATEGFTRKFSVDLLKDRTKLSKENSWTISEYIIAMKREINPRLQLYRNHDSGPFRNFKIKGNWKEIH